MSRKLPSRFEDYLTDPEWCPISPEDGARLLRLTDGPLPRHPRILTTDDGALKEARGYVAITCGMFRPTTTKFNKRSWRTTYLPAIPAGQVPA
jgi:hypothetical protein